MDDDALAQDIKHNPLLEHFAAGAMVSLLAWAAAHWQISTQDLAMAAFAAGSVIDAAAWPVAHAANSVYGRFIVRAYLRAFPLDQSGRTSPPDPKQSS
jgi:hypothetical protein